MRNNIDITPGNDNLSPEEDKEYRAENQPRGHEALSDREKEIKELKAEIAELEEMRKMLENADPSVAAKNAEYKKELNEELEILDISPRALGEKAHRSNPFKTRITIMAAAAVSAIGIMVGSVALTRNPDKNTKQQNANSAPAKESVIIINDDTDNILKTDEADATPEAHEVETSGIVDGYDKEGMWTDEDKPNTVAFSNFEKVTDIFEGDIKESIKYVAKNETEAMSDYISALDDKLRPEGFEKLNMMDTNDRIENKLSAEEYDKAQEEFNNIIDKAEVEEITLNGKYTNAYEAVKDGDDLIGSKEALGRGAAINHETMQLIQCNTNENGSKAYRLFWRGEDGKIIDSVTVKGSCGQVVEKQGSSTRLEGLGKVEEEIIKGGGGITIVPDVPDEPDVPDVPDKPKKKWGKHGDPHAGTDYKQTIVVNPAVPDISDINLGNLGYINDGGATPGSASGENIGGGEDQSDGNMAGENQYHGDDSGGQAVDSGGNQSQEQAQENNKPGEDNNSDKEEENAVAEGKF